MTRAFLTIGAAGLSAAVCGAAELPKGAEPAQKEVRHLDLVSRQFTMTDAQFGEEMRKIAAEYPALAKLTSLGVSREGRQVLMLTLTDFAAGGERKPGCFVQGHIHSKEMSGTVAGLFLARRLLEEHRPGGILTKQVFYVVPRCNPDGADRMVHMPANERSGWGGLVDDPNPLEPTDINGDGVVTSMRQVHPNGRWMEDPAHPGQMIARTPDAKGPFYAMGDEGMMRNWDGKFKGLGNGYWRVYEDWNRNWSYGWRKDQWGSGEYPLSIPEVRMQADFLESHRNIRSVLCLHNGWGMVMTHNVDEKDFPHLKRLADRASELIGYPVENEGMRPKSETQKPQHGRFSEYCYERLGLFCFTMELGTRETSAGLSVAEAKEHPFAYTAPYEVVAQQDAHPELPTCFFKWRKFNHPQVGEVEIGGSCPTLFACPLPEHLARICEGVYRFLVEYAADAASDGKLERP